MKFFRSKSLLATVWLLGFVFVCSNLVLASLYNDRIYPGVRLGSTNLGGLTHKDALSVVRERVSSYRLKIKIDSKTYKVTPQQLGADYEVNLVVSNAMQLGHKTWLPLLGFWQARHSSSLSYAYSIDHQQLTDYISKLSIEQAQAPVNAQIVVENGVPKVNPDKNGLGVDPLHLASIIEQSIDDHAPELTVVREPIAAEIQAVNVTDTVEAAKKLVAAKLELTYTDKTFRPTPAQIGQWLDFVKDGSHLKAEVNSGRVLAYVKTISASVNVKAVNKIVNMVNGELKSEEAGVNGLAVDETNLTAKIVAALPTGQASVAIPTAPVAFKTVYNKTIQLEGRYIEINLSSQHLWAYQEGRVVFDSPVTSGATGAGFPTVQGLFSIYSKERNRYLNGRPLGYNYNVFVQYWMPFHADYGLHDASWRGTFGGPDYYYNGSHGCINLPTATAAWLFDWSIIGTPVWVHS